VTLAAPPMPAVPAVFKPDAGASEAGCVDVAASTPWAAAHCAPTGRPRGTGASAATTPTARRMRARRLPPDRTATPHALDPTPNASRAR